MRRRIKQAEEARRLAAKIARQEDDDALADIAKEWLQARRVVMNFLQELQPGMPVADLEHNAAAVIARLSHAGFALTKIGTDHAR